MPKDVVFIPNIDLGDGRNKSYGYSINSWKHFCDKYDCELLVWEDLLLPVEQMKITWQRYYMFDILEANNINYDQVLIVDADTIVHPECPNFFTETNGKYSVVRNNGSFEWVRRSIDGFSKLLFNDEVPFKVWDYINCGFQIVNKDHKEFFEYVRNYYLENQYDIQNVIDQVKAGTDQTIINFLLRQQNIELNYLPICYNLQDLHSKQLLFIHPQMWFDDKLIFENCGYVFHFNAIPPNEMNRDANYWMERTYKEFYTMKKVLLDCGANKGQSYEWFMKNRDDSGEYEIHCFEPVSSFSKNLSQLPMTYHKEAVWIEDGTIDFYDKTAEYIGRLSSTLYKHKTDNAGQGTRTTVSCIDFSKFIKDNFKLLDYIIVKMDIEGAEYKVIEKMLEDKTFEYIDEFYIEFHGGKIKDLYPYYAEVKKRTGLEVENYILQELDKFDLKYEVHPYKNWGNY